MWAKKSRETVATKDQRNSGNSGTAEQRHIERGTVGTKEYRRERVERK